MDEVVVRSGEAGLGATDAPAVPVHKPRSERQSGLELMRIILMLAIIAHHYVVNSGVTFNFDISNVTPNMAFLEFWGMWGKTAINAYVLVTGWFMCTSKPTWQKWLAILLERMFYAICILVIFAVTGISVPGRMEVFKALFGWIYGIGDGFIASYLAFYLLIPALNALLRTLSKRQLQGTIAALLLVFTMASTFFFSDTAFWEPGWYATLYLIAAYMRLYPAEVLSSKRFSRRLLVISLVLAYASVAVPLVLSAPLGVQTEHCYYFLSNSDKPLALLCGVAFFLFFKNLDIGSNRVINTISQTTFGVLLIHANSDAMRWFLWRTVLDVPGMYFAPFWQLVAHAVLSVAVIFAVCSAIDLLRIRFVERPALAWISRHAEQIEGTAHSLVGWAAGVADKVAHALAGE